MTAQSRRQFASSSAVALSSAALSPLLQQIYAQAAGREEDLPRRFVFVIKSSGLTAEAIRPRDVVGDIDQTIEVSLRNSRLPDTLEALHPFRDQLLILDGLSGSNFTGNHSSYYGALSCCHAPDKPVAATIDCLLGALNPAPFPIYGFSPNGHSIGNNFGPTVQETAVFPRISAFGSNKPMAYQASAEKAWRELFGSVAELASGGRKEFALQDNLLDFLRDDVRRVSTLVSSAERDKLDQYLKAFESVRARNTKLKDMSDILRRHSPKMTSQYASKVFTERVAVFFELTAAALIAGLTNVISIRADWLSTKYASFGFGSTSVHDIGHNKLTANGLRSEDARGVIRKFHVNEIAQLAARLDSVPEGNGTMLDYTAIIYMSDGADAHHSSRKNWPFVIVGGKRTRLRTGGRYVRYPDYQRPGHRTIGSLYNTLLHCCGDQSRTHFGQLDAQLRDLDLAGPLNELMSRTA